MYIYLLTLIYTGITTLNKNLFIFNIIRIWEMYSRKCVKLRFDLRTRYGPSQTTFRIHMLQMICQHQLKFFKLLSLGMTAINLIMRKKFSYSSRIKNTRIMYNRGLPPISHRVHPQKDLTFPNSLHPPRANPNHLLSKSYCL